uniref:Uncharacterized protein n=1 Tax=Oryza sativa subsp. japonica TaxID=39947 RepID=Q6YX45_ORYSJ|nr:hypothetical protein [Oryza sativa Japonica Group]
MAHLPLHPGVVCHCQCPVPRVVLVVQPNISNARLVWPASTLDTATTRRGEFEKRLALRERRSGHHFISFSFSSTMPKEPNCLAAARIHLDKAGSCPIESSRMEANGYVILSSWQETPIVRSERWHRV